MVGRPGVVPLPLARLGNSSSPLFVSVPRCLSLFVLSANTYLTPVFLGENEGGLCRQGRGLFGNLDIGTAIHV